MKTINSITNEIKKYSIDDIIELEKHILDILRNKVKENKYSNIKSINKLIGKLKNLPIEPSKYQNDIRNEWN